MNGKSGVESVGSASFMLVISIECRVREKERAGKGGLMFRALAMVAVLFFTAPVTAEPLILASKYAVNGTSPGGSSYQGVATIQILSDTTFAIQWVIAGKTTKGFGMRRNDAVAASYMMNGVPGLIIYQVEGNGLDGLWAVKGEDGGGSEHLTPVQ